MRPTSILDTLRRRVLLADGAMGTELQRMGLEPGGCGELWNLVHPEKVLEVHRAFVNAGAQLITTNSFRGNRFALGLYGLEGRVRELNQAAVRIARDAAGQKAWVLGSMGPFGGFLEPVGEASAKDVEAAFTEQAQALLAGGADAIIIETMTAADEIHLAIQAARRAGAPLVISTMTFARTKTGYRTMTGVSPGQAVHAMRRAGAAIIGCNCGTDLSSADYVEIVSQFRAVTDARIIVQPNAGRPELVGTEVVYKQTPKLMAASVEDFIAAGANIIGGCCGTTPEHIRRFAEKLKPGG